MIVDYDDSSTDGSESQDSELEKKTKSSSMAVSGEENNSKKRNNQKMEAIAKQKMLSKRPPCHKSESEYLEMGFGPTTTSLNNSLPRTHQYSGKTKKIKTNLYSKMCEEN